MRWIGSLGKTFQVMCCGIDQRVDPERLRAAIGVSCCLRTFLPQQQC